MLKKYWKLPFRHLLKDRQFTLLNLLGLSTGMACALLIYVWVRDEVNVDQFNVNKDRLYEVLENRVQSSGIWTAQSQSGPMTASLKKDFPEVEAAIASDNQNPGTLTVGVDKNIKAEGKYAGADFFHMFSYDLIEGNPSQVLSDKSSIVLSDLTATTLFGSPENAMGKSVQYEHDQVYKVTGVYKDRGLASSDKFDFVLNMQILFDKYPNMNDWGNTSCHAFVLLRPGTDVAQFNAKIAGYVKQKTNNQITYRTPFLVKYSDFYLHGRYQDGKQVGGRIEYVHLFSLIAIFILVIACINFMNLSTAKAAGRAKEVGIKKTIGAARGMLILQYYGESMLMAFAALILSLVLAMFMMPYFNVITNKQLSLSHPDLSLILSVLGITLFTGLVAGSYPALYLSGFKPALVLKGKVKNSVSELFVRKGLVVFQFTLSVVLIISVIVIYRQINFIQTMNLGYDRDHMLAFNKEGKLNDVKKAEIFLQAVRNVPGVVGASSIGSNLTGHSSGTYGVSWPGRDPKDRTEFEDVGVGLHMIETLGVTMKEGRAFSEGYPSDTAGIIFNEAAIHYMGLKNPIGQRVILWDSPVNIIGVVKDFHFQSLHEKVKPLFFRLAPDDAYQFMVKLQAGKEQAAIRSLTQLYQQYNPGFTFSYRFLDADYAAMYAAEQRVSILSRYFAGLAILISCLGLFGLAAFTAQRRSKEIGIRKVLGASVGRVVILLSQDFLKLVGVAILIAFPVSWWIAQSWLSGFAYRISVGAGIFLLSGFTIILITLLTVGFMSVKAALKNPVNSLKVD
jgi:putative ABC transport system permease protein